MPDKMVANTIGLKTKRALGKEFHVRTANIFRIAATPLGPEDKFTAFLHYLIQNIPSIGQGIVDEICKRAGIAPAKFEKAIDHPTGDDENRPDFMLSCKEFDILCEHKLDSELGNRQLERYLCLPQSRPTHVVLITSRRHALSQEVLQSNSYLRPKDIDPPFFFWEDFYPVIASHNERLAQDFTAYMCELGMAPCPLPGEWERLFHDPLVAEKFYDTTKEMRFYFTQMGAQCNADPTRLGFQVKYPRDWLHLLYFHVSKTAKSTAASIESPYLIASAFVQKNDLHHVNHLVSQEIHAEHGLIVAQSINRDSDWNQDLVLSYQCIGSLKNYLARNTADTKTKLLGFGRAVFEHVTNPSK